MSLVDLVNEHAQGKRKVPEGAHTVGLIYRKITLGPKPVIRRFTEYQNKYGYVRLYLNDIEGIIEVARRGYDFHAFFDKEGNILNMSLMVALLKEKEDKEKRILEFWAEGYTEREYRELNGEEYNDSWYGHDDEIHKQWKKVVVKHERKFQRLTDCGMPEDNWAKDEEWNVFFLEHKPSKFQYRVSLMKYSNGIMTSGSRYSSGPPSYQGSASGAWLPYWVSRLTNYHSLMTIDEYEKHIYAIHADALKIIDRFFEKKPKVRQKMIDSLNEQMNHDKFRGLHYENASAKHIARVLEERKLNMFGVDSEYG